MKWTVHSPLFFRKIVEIERFPLRAAILHECQNYLGRGAIIPNACLLGTLYLKIKMAAINGKVRAISRRSHEKMGDCGQSTNDSGYHSVAYPSYSK